MISLITLKSFDKALTLGHITDEESPRYLHRDECAQYLTPVGESVVFPDLIEYGLWYLLKPPVFALCQWYGISLLQLTIKAF